MPALFKCAGDSETDFNQSLSECACDSCLEWPGSCTAPDIRDFPKKRSLSWHQRRSRRKENKEELSKQGDQPVRSHCGRREHDQYVTGRVRGPKMTEQALNLRAVTQRSYKQNGRREEGRSARSNAITRRMCFVSPACKALCSLQVQETFPVGPHQYLSAAFHQSLHYPAPLFSLDLFLHQGNLKKLEPYHTAVFIKDKIHSPQQLPDNMPDIAML